MSIDDRKPGRSFTDPQKPLGEELVERAARFGGDADEGVYGRSSVHPTKGHGVAERARAVSVLRKAEELMASANPSGDTESGWRRALELAAGRCGMKLREYDVLVRGDAELQELERAVMEAARMRAKRG
jgi:hypothetical protein